MTFGLEVEVDSTGQTERRRKDGVQEGHIFVPDAGFPSSGLGWQRQFQKEPKMLRGHRVKP